MSENKHMNIVTQNDHDPYWINNPFILINSKKITQFYPTMSMTMAEKINSIIRFSLYLGLVLSLVYRTYLFIYIPIIVMVGSIIVYYSQPPKVRESYHQVEPRSSDMKPPSPNDTYDELVDQSANVGKNALGCVAPTEENPFMNAMLTDDRHRPAACPADKNIKKEINTHFNNNLFMDVSDVYNNRNSQREFYTMPSTTIPNDQDSFAKWLYGLPPTCKEGNGAMCVAGNPQRLNGQSSFSPDSLI